MTIRVRARYTPPMNKNTLLTTDEMARADAAAVQAGTSGMALMEHAGRKVADVAGQMVRRLGGHRPIVVLAGPGNNGGDGYVAARYLRQRGHRVRIAVLGDPYKLKGDAKSNFERWQTPTEPLAPMALEEHSIVIDALFGAGLTRDVDGAAAAVLEAARVLDLPCIAVDLPSGLNGNTGQIMGTALQATETVTFFRKKPGHLLYPGRALCGDIHVVDIGIPTAVLDDIAPKTFENTPALWRRTVFGASTATDHKYHRGHVVVVGGARMTGAARLAALAARRAGAGLVTLAVPTNAWSIYAAAEPGNLVEATDDLRSALEDPRRSAVVIGPGLGASAATRTDVQAALQGGTRSVVLDADALSSFEDTPQALFDAVQGPVVMTPHEGEFKRLFDLKGDKLTRARAAAKLSGAVIVLKGADTVIAAPDGRAAINASAPPWLATAGSGDVLAGIIGAFLGQRCAPFEAAAAGVWCHGQAAQYVGPGLIAEDLPTALINVFKGSLDLNP